MLAGHHAAHAGIVRFCNKTPVPITAAVGYLGANDWMSEGWWNIAPGSCARVFSGPVLSNNFYMFGKALHGEWLWGGNSNNGSDFCTTDSVFTLVRSGCNVAGTSVEFFRNFNIGDSQDFERDFTCGDCSLPAVHYDPASGTVEAYGVIPAAVGQASLNIPVEGHFSLGRDSNAVSVSMSLYANLSPLQDSIDSIISNAANQNEECGDRVSTYGASLTPSGNGAELAVNARYERWYCTYADVPQTTCHDTRITVGPFRTKSIPRCSVTMQTTRTSKNKVFQQSGSARIELSPRLNGGYQIGLSATVEEARLAGLGQLLADLFRVNLRSIAQGRLNSAVGGSQMSWSIPAEIRQFAMLDDVAFYNANGTLMLRAQGRFSIPLSQASQLCSQLATWNGCTGR
jgi:uncharacterized membrane protein